MGFGVWLKKQKVRIYNIDAPEMRSKDEEEKLFGLAAKKKLEELLSLSDDITLRSFQDVRGKYGRIIGDFIIYDLVTTCAEDLCSEGYAVKIDDKTKDVIQEEHRQNRKLLISQGKINPKIISE